MKCLLEGCPKQVQGRAKTCSPAHRKALSRSVTQTVTRSVTKSQSVTENVTVNKQSVTEIPQTVTNEATSVTLQNESVTFEPGTVTKPKGISIINNQVFENGVLVPEEELNTFYGGLKGKLELSTDLVYAQMFRVNPVILREKERLEKVNSHKPTNYK